MATEYVEYDGQYSGEQIDSAIARVGNLKTVATSGSYNDLTDKPTIPAAANNATLTIQKNGVTAGTFTADASTDKTINLSIPTTASDIGALPASTKYAGASTAGGAATSASKLTVNAGSSTNPVYFTGGLPTPCTYNLEKSVPANAVFTDTTYESKSAASGGTAVSLVTTGEKYTWNNKQSAISDLSTIRSGAALGATAVQPVTGKGLSTNDYTTAEKNKLSGLTQYTNAMAAAEVFGAKTSISSNADLNNITSAGKFVCGSATVAASLSNCPTGKPFVLLVDYIAGDTRIIQRIYAYDSTTGVVENFQRCYIGSGWQSWYLTSVGSLGKQLETNGDLNDLLTTWRWHAPTTAIATSISNIPEGVTTAFFGATIPSVADSRCIQILVPNDDTGDWYKRRYTGSWQAWVKYKADPTKQLAENVDLDSLTSEGIWYGYNAVGSSALHLPVPNGNFNIRVENTMIGAVYLKQKCTIARIQNVYTEFVRVKNVSSSGAWQPWEMVSAVGEIGWDLVTNDDLDNFTTPGFYQCTGPTIGNTLSHSPTPQPFKLRVDRFTSTSNYIQEITAVENTTSGQPEVYRRVKLASGWKPWYKFTGTAVS